MKESMKKIEEMMRLSIFEVFEKMFYLFLEPLSIEYGEYDMESSIEFDGRISGEVVILLSRDIVKTMVQNMLGLGKDEITGQHMEDCSKEAVNMVCGNFLSKLDSASVFNLSIPSFSENPPLPPFDKGGMGGFLSENTCRMDFDSDEGNVGVIVEVR